MFIIDYKSLPVYLFSSYLDKPGAGVLDTAQLPGSMVSFYWKMRGDVWKVLGALPL